MKLVIFGATGNTGIELVQQSLEKEYAVTAFVRDPARLPIEHERLTVAVGDIFDAAGVAKSIENHDAVICALGSGASFMKNEVRTAGTKNIILGMQQHGVKRLIVVSAMGTGDSWQRLSMFHKLIYGVLMKNIREEHEKQESAVKASQLDWTIVRPTGLNDNAGTGSYNVGEDIEVGSSAISRADVADLIVKHIDRNDLVGKAVTITT